MQKILRAFGLAALVLIFGQYGSAKDLYVALTGSDAVTYADNSITNPWATPHKAWAEARAGDTIYFRQGTWSPATVINTKYIGNPGTAENPIKFASYPGEMATFQWMDKPGFVNGDGSGGILWLWKPYHHIHNMTFRAKYPDVDVTGYGYGGAPIQTLGPNIKITYCTIEILRHIYTNNSALIHCDLSSHFIEISNNLLIGPGAENMGSAGVSGAYFIRTRGVKVFNNEIYKCIYGIFQKHSNKVDDVPSEEYNQWENNYIHDCSGYGINGRPNRTKIVNNIVVGSGLSLSSGSNGGDGYAGGDFNVIKNNTIIQSDTAKKVFDLDLSEYPLLSENPASTDPYTGCIHNDIQNNVIIGKELRLNPYGPPKPTDTGTPIANYEYNNHTDYNLYSVSSPSQLISEDRVGYSLPQWRNRILAVHGRVVDQASILGSPIFVGGGSPNSIPGYKLTDASPGKNAGSDGRDMGADIAKVGIQPLTSLTITSPNGGEAWQRGWSRPITWTSTGVTGNVVIELVQNGRAVGIIAENVAATVGSFAWTVGRLANGTVITGTGCKIRIRTASGSASSQSYPF